MLNISAHRNPFTVNPEIKESTKSTKRALITKVKKPSVRIFIGSVRTKMTGFMNALIIPKISATIRAVINPSTETPGSR